MKVYTGSYIGDGVSGRKIKVPFTPTLVIVKRNGASAAVWRTESLSANASSYFGPTADLTTGILALSASQFTVGTAAEVNTLDETYYFIALAGVSGDVEVGSYVGDGTDNRNISWSGSHAAAPLFMLIKQDNSTNPGIMRDSHEAADASTVLASTPTINTANLIQALTSSNFQVGTDGQVNTNAINYHYFALFADTSHLAHGTYTGTGVNNREVNDIGVKSSFVLIHNNTTALSPVFRVHDQQGDATFPLIGATAATTGQIISVFNDDFQLGTNNSVNKNGDTFHYLALESSNWAISGKYHVSLDSKGYIIQSNSNGRPLYEKKPAPSFVNKFGSGDSSYRDSSFWQFWAQVNWRNGAKQLRFDDAGKFWKSQNIDNTQLEQFTLSNRLVSAGQVSAGTKVLTMPSFRADQSWWNSNYGYRQQLTIAAPATKQLPVGYPIQVTIDSGALQTASKVRSDRKDWRIVYWNGSTWTDIKRDYVTATLTVFALQAAINAGASDNNYYVHYGYASESTDQQPSTEADWNAVYGMYGTTPDANSLAVLHFKEGSGTTIADNASTHDFTSSGMGWVNTGPFGRAGDFTGAHDYASNSDSAFNLGSITVEGWFKYSGFGGTATAICRRDGSGIRLFHLYVTDLGKLGFLYGTDSGGGNYGVIGSTTLSTGVWYHLVGTHDGAGTVKVYINNVLDGTNTGGPSAYSQPTADTKFALGASGVDEANIYAANVRISNIARSSFPYAILPSELTVTAGTETSLQPPASTFSLFAGLSDGTIWLWGGSTTWTKEFDTRRVEWYETTTDSNKVVGDTGGTETAQAQAFKVSAAMKMKAVEVYIKKAAGTPGNITVRVETNNAGVPSGTLVDATNATATITAFTTSTYGWVTVEFPAAFALAATTTYWLVLKTGAAANDNNYNWAANSAGGYGNGNMAHSTDGGSTWSADAGIDAWFRILGAATSVNCSFVSRVGGTLKIFYGIGDIASQVNGDARLYSYDGTTYKLEKIFATATESQILAINESKIGSTTNLFIAIGPQGRIYSTSDLSTFTLSEDFEKPENPGYPYALFEYNQLLYAGGGSPELLYNKYYNGFFYQFDQVSWTNVFPFTHTVLKTMQFYDAFLFLGSYHGQIFVFNTVTLDPLFSFSDDYNYSVQIAAQFFFDDKLWFGLAPQDGITPANESVWVFDRHGMHSAVTASGVNGYYSFAQTNNQLFVGTGDDGYVYKLDKTQYQSSGYLQTSYFDAILPSIPKLYNEFVVQYDPLPTGTTITVFYKFKESDSWTQLGDAIVPATDVTSSTLSFPTGTISKKITFKIQLDTSDPAVTPTVKEYVLKYSLYPTRKWQWNLRVLAKDYAMLLDRTKDTRTGLQVIMDVEEAQQSEKINTFVDLDGKSYSVLFHDLDEDSWVIKQGDRGVEDTIAITLLEA